MPVKNVMHRIFWPEKIGPMQKICLQDLEELEHLKKVLRAKNGDFLEIVDKRGWTYAAVISSVANNFVELEIRTEIEAGNKQNFDLYLLQGLAKGEKMELIIQKAVELGATAIYPLAMERSVVKLSAEKSLKKQQRWQKIALNAAQQSKGLTVPQVKTVSGLKTALQALPPQTCILALWEKEKEESLKKALQEMPENRNIALIIGPEGGIDPQEMELIKSFQGKSVTIGSRILRTETAGLAALTMVQYHLGDLGGTERIEADRNS